MSSDTTMDRTRRKFDMFVAQIQDNLAYQLKKLCTMSRSEWDGTEEMLVTFSTQLKVKLRIDDRQDEPSDEEVRKAIEQLIEIPKFAVLTATMFAPIPGTGVGYVLLARLLERMTKGKVILLPEKFDHMEDTPVPGRTTNEEIDKLAPGEVFVFGSNLSGRHSKGAAKTAMKFGAIYGQATGIQGRTYGIPTKDKTIRRVLRIDEIKPFVDDFVVFAKANPTRTFLTTSVGCGLAGYRPKDIAPLFKDAIDVKNIHLPAKFWHVLIHD